MSRNTISRSVRRSFSLFASCAVLAGCLSEGTTDEPQNPPTNTSDLQDHELTGSVGDGPVVNASILVFSKTGEELGAVSSGTTAEFDVTVKARGADYPLNLVASNGTDLVTQGQPDFAMRSMVTKPGRRTVANINPFTAFAYELAVDLPGGADETNIETSLGIVGSELNSGLSTLRGSAVMTTDVDGSNIAEILRASEALGEIVRRVRDNMLSAGFGTTGDDVVAAVGSDLVDGRLDGRGGPRTDPRISALAGLARAQVSLETMQNGLRVQGSDALIRINSALAQVFSGTPSPTLTELALTSDMLDDARVGLLAASALQPGEEASTLLSELTSVSAGMLPADVRQQLSSAGASTFVAVRSAIAVGSDADIELVNQVLRTGTLPSQNNAPVISGTPATTVDAGSLYSFQPTASDADGDSLTFAISGMPAWASFSSASGELSGVPGTDDAGIYPGIGISVSDGTDTVSLPTFTITVAAVVSNTPPVISGTPPTQATVGSEYDFLPTASDSDGDALAFSIVNRPAWASFDAGTGRLLGTPQGGDTGDWAAIEISVSDGEDTVSLPAFTITVNDLPPANTAPTISGNPPASVVAGSAYSFTPQASDADGDSLTFSVSGLPGWAAFNGSTGRLSGTPGDADVGTFGGISITVSDGQASASLGPFAITVEPAPNTPPTIGGNPPASVEAGSAYSFTPQASDADGDSLTFSVTAQPGWASFDSSTGRLSGTPGDADVGTWSGISITVSDGEDSATLGPFAITVDPAPVNSPPTISGNPPASVTAGSAYGFTPQASDADGDSLTFSITGQPGWATFSSSTGRLSGTPGDADVGSYTGITISVSDGEDSATLGPFDITVEAVVLGSATLSWTPPTQNTDGSPLNDLTAYRIHWGPSPGNYTQSVRVDNPGLTSYVVENLASGTWYFATTAINGSEVESDYSNEGSKTIQ